MSTEISHGASWKWAPSTSTRQEYLEKAIEWIVNSNKDRDIEIYMAIHQGDAEATGLWLHFQKVVNWIETLFPKYRREMKGLEWGRLYKEFSAKSYNPKELEEKVAALMSDKEVQNNKGVYEYLLSGGARKEKLNLRQFDDDEKRAAYEAQKGICPVCGGHFEYEEMEMRPRHRRRVARARSASREAVARGRATT